MKNDRTNAKEIRIKDPAVCRMIAEEQREGGDSTATKTAARIVTEYRTMKRFIRPARRRKAVPA